MPTRVVRYATARSGGWKRFGLVEGLSVLEAVVELAKELVEQVSGGGGVVVTVVAALSVMLAGGSVVGGGGEGPHLADIGQTRLIGDHTGVVTKLFAAVAAALSIPFLGLAPMAHADAYCNFGNLLIPEEVHHVGTYRDATCAAVADIVTTSDRSDCVRAVTNYVVSRGYDPYVGKDIALHNC